MAIVCALLLLKTFDHHHNTINEPSPDQVSDCYCCRRCRCHRRRRRRSLLRFYYFIALKICKVFITIFHRSSSTIIIDLKVCKIFLCTIKPKSISISKWQTNKYTQTQINKCFLFQHIHKNGIWLIIFVYIKAFSKSQDMWCLFGYLDL